MTYVYYIVSLGQIFNEFFLLLQKHIGRTIKALKNIPLERYKEPKKTDFSQEEKERRLLWYLERHAYITTIGYQGLNGCTQYLARKELKQFVVDGILVENGTRRICIYTMRPESMVLPDGSVDLL